MKLLWFLILVMLVGCGEQRGTSETTTEASSVDSTSQEAGDTAVIETAAASKSLPAAPPKQNVERFAYSERPYRENVAAAIRIADSLCALPSFWANIANYPDQKIDNSSFTMRMLSDTLQAFRETTTVEYIGPRPRANAKTSAERIGLARSAVRSDKYSLAVTLIHEWVHAVDYSLH